MPCARLLLVLLLVASPLVAGADSVRTWTDRDGVIHFSNLPKGKRSGARFQPFKDGVKVVLEGTDEPAASPLRKAFTPRNVSHFDEYLSEACARYRIPEALARAILAAESNFDPAAVSRAGAMGLMQLMPQTALMMYVDDILDPRENIHGGVRYLRLLTNEFDGDLVKVIAAYNAGPSAVKKSGGIPPFEETREYVERVLRLYQRYKDEARR
jgi:soluble lytic murein transglycosylase-like protein